MRKAGTRLKFLPLIAAATLIRATIAVDYPRAKEACTVQMDCFDEFEFCQRFTDEADGVCSHKELTPVMTIEVHGYLMTFLVLLTSNMGGLGGGGAVIPICMVFFGFDTK